jgi:hypothetical protein
MASAILPEAQAAAKWCRTCLQTGIKGGVVKISQEVARDFVICLLQRPGARSRQSRHHTVEGTGNLNIGTAS